MSRGPGRWQRAVLAAVAAAVDDHGTPRWVTVDEIAEAEAARQGEAVTVDPGKTLPEGQRLGRARREAIRRAIRTLHDADRVHAGWVRTERPTSSYRYSWKRTVTRRVLAARRPLTPAQEAAEAREYADQARAIARRLAHGPRDTAAYFYDRAIAAAAEAERLEAALAAEENR